MGIVQVPLDHYIVGIKKMLLSIFRRDLAHHIYHVSKDFFENDIFPLAIGGSPRVLDNYWRLVGISFTISCEDSRASAFLAYKVTTTLRTRSLFELPRMSFLFIFQLYLELRPSPYPGLPRPRLEKDL